MKIGIDARFWGRAGPGRYVKNLVLALEKIDHENEYVIFLNLQGLEDYKPKAPNFRKVRVDIPWYSLAEQMRLPSVFAHEKLDLLHVPHYNIPIFYPGKIAVTIHDLTIHRFSTARATTRAIPIYRLKRLVYRFVFWLAIKRAKMIFVPTGFVKKDLLKTYSWLDSRKITVSYEGVDPKFGRSDSNQDTKYEILNTKYGIRKPYILYVGSMYPHKNLPCLIEAFKLVAEEYEDITLVLVGKCDFFQERLREEASTGETLGVEERNPKGWGTRRPNRIIFPAFRAPDGYVPDEDLVALYREALFFVFPSLSEGFGLPALEAMNFGIPVVASKSTSIPEVCGGAALYFDPEDPDDMAQKMQALIKNPALREELIRKGFENLKRFSWEKMVKETRAGYMGDAT